MKKPICDKISFLSFEGKGGVTQVWKLTGKNGFFFMAGMAIDADGAPNAYDPENKHGLDFLGNAGKPGNWWALATDNGKPNGNPIIQEEGEFEGFYISQTSVRDDSKKDEDITYVDARHIPCYVLPPKLVGSEKARLGDLGVVYNTKNEAISFAIFADVGPGDSIGEGSIALGHSLGISTDLRKKKAGQSKGVFYLVFPETASTPAWPRTIEDMQEQAEATFQQWGGLSQLKACASQLAD